MTTARFKHHGGRIVARTHDAAPRCSTVRRSTADTTPAGSSLTRTPSVAEIAILGKLWYRMYPNSPHLPEPGQTGYTELMAAAASKGLLLDATPADMDRRSFERNEMMQRRGRAFWDGRKNAPRTTTTVYFPEDLDLEDGEFNLDLQTHDGVLHHSERTLIQMQKIADAFWAHGGRQ
jgi:hypothetical protein